MVAFPEVLALQVQTAGSADRETLLVIFVGIIALFFLALIIGLIGAVIYALRVKRDIERSIKSIKATVEAKAYPVVASTNELIRELTPKIKTITENAAEISHTVRAQVTDLDATLSDVTSKAKAQADRVNGMVSSTLQTTTNVVSSVERGIKVPIREVEGLLAGIKAGWDVITSPAKPSTRTQVRRAAQAVGDWEESITRQAERATEVNRSPLGGRFDDDRYPSSQSAGHSAVGGAEEIVTGTSGTSGTSEPVTPAPAVAPKSVI